MSKARSYLLASMSGAIALGVLTACSSMLETTQYDWSAPVGAQKCSAGAYYLPRRLLSFTLGPPVAVEGAKAAPARNELTLLTPIAAPDPRLPLCLDYLSAPTADDMLVIDRTADGLLKKITANAEDKSLEIAQAAIDVFRQAAVASGAARSTAVLFEGTALAGKFEMDPFDVPESAAINNSIKDMGYCIYVEGYTFDPGRFTP